MFIYLPRNSANYNSPIITQKDTPTTNHHPTARTDSPCGWSLSGGRDTIFAALIRPLTADDDTQRVWFVLKWEVCSLQRFFCSRASATDKQAAALHEDTAGKRIFKLYLTDLFAGWIWMLFPCAVYSKSCRVCLTRDTCPLYRLWRSTGNR